MTLTEHLVLTGIATVALSPLLGGEQLALFAAGSVLIDVDHYFLFIQRRHSLSVTGMFRYFNELHPIESTIPYVGLCIFHTVDFFVLLGLLAIRYPALLYLLAGCLFHFTADLIYLRHRKTIFIRPFFIIEHLIRRRTKGYPWY